jgi:hypothetical protein
VFLIMAGAFVVAALAVLPVRAEERAAAQRAIDLREA